VVDDSPLSREALKAALESDGGLAVVAEARSGEEAVELLRRVKPDLVTMDLQMPGMGGLKAIEAITRERPTPIVVISERSAGNGVDLAYEALSRGALELVPKASVFGAGPADTRRFAAHLRALAAARVAGEATAPAPQPGRPPSVEPPLLLGIGASTGGPKALVRLLTGLPASYPLPIAVVQHMHEEFFESFVRFLSDASRRRVVVVRTGQALEPGVVHLAPPRQELFIREPMHARLVPPPPRALISPSVDSLFFSMAKALQGRGLGVLLTGMGEDGAQGLLRMRRMGSRTVAQDRASSAVYGMPRVARELGAAEAVLPLDEIAAWLTAAVELPAPPRPSSPSAVNRPRVRAVLVVDDDPASARAARVALEAGGYEVHALDNPLTVARELRKRPVDLLLFETEWSTVKGEVVLASLREHGPGVPVVLYSRLAPGPLAERARACAAAGALAKGTPGPALVREVARLIGPPSKPPGA
jgi:two-component system chemotaxis response regulator CheB